MRSCFLISIMLLAIIAGCGRKAPSHEKGKALYATYCQGCHMEDGKGVPGMNAPLAGSAYANGDKNRLVQIVLQGSAAFRNDPPREYRNAMPPIPSLKDDEIAAILSYVRSSFGNDAPEITMTDIQAARAKTD